MKRWGDTQSSLKILFVFNTLFIIKITILLYSYICGFIINFKMQIFVFVFHIFM